MNDDFELVKNLLNRPGSYVIDISIDFEYEQVPNATVNLYIANSNITKIGYQTTDRDQMLYFKENLDGEQISRLCFNKYF